MNTIQIQLPTDPSYWGSTATDSDVERILDRLESMLSQEFSSRADLRFERTETPRGTGVHSEDDELAEEVFRWIEENWTAAL
jgi:hypothetical protein